MNLFPSLLVRTGLGWYGLDGAGRVREPGPREEKGRDGDRVGGCDVMGWDGMGWADRRCEAREQRRREESRQTDRHNFIYAPTVYHDDLAVTGRTARKERSVNGQWSMEKNERESAGRS